MLCNNLIYHGGVVVSKHIYLTATQKRMLDEADVGVRNLTWDSLSSVMSESDGWSIRQQSITKFTPISPLGKIGIIFSDDEVDGSYSAVDAQYNMSKLLNTDNGTESFIDCVCKKENDGNITFVCWEVEVNGETNSMQQHNLAAVVNALSDVSGIEYVKYSQAFAVMLCA